MNLGRKRGLDGNILAKFNKHDGSCEVLFHFRSGKLTFQDGNRLRIATLKATIMVSCDDGAAGHMGSDVFMSTRALENGFSEFRWKQDTRSPVGLFSLLYEVCVVKLKCR